jgi:cell wall-associated NlpC family hydrolase
MHAPRVLVLGAAALAVAGVLMGAATGVVSASLGTLTGVTGLAGVTDPAGPTATGTIPPAMRTLYQAAAATCPGLPWTVLAAIGTVESGNDTSDLPGVHSGANGAGAEGPMQFEPATFVAYDEPVPPGGANPPSPYDPVDAVYAAARLLCADGAAGGADIAGAIFAYNHDEAYVVHVLSLAQSYGQAAPSDGTALGVGATAAVWALAQVGTPYVWGGETPGVGFDCSGLTQAAYRAAGVTLPRVAQSQFDAESPLPPGAVLLPGDLVFFGAGPGSVSHVGLYLGVEGGRTFMVDAPHSGAAVRVEPFPATPGARWGSDIFVGATRPGA